MRTVLNIYWYTILYHDVYIYNDCILKQKRRVAFFHILEEGTELKRSRSELLVEEPTSFAGISSSFLFQFYIKRIEI